MVHRLAATSHMTNTKSILRNAKRVKVVGNNERMQIDCAGDVSAVLQSDEKETNAFIRDAEHVPEMSVNLLSVRQLTLKGNKVVFENDSCQIFNDCRELLVTAKASDNLYNNCVMNVNKSENALVVSHGFELWHRRLAHICDDNLRKVMRAIIVNAAGIKTEKCVIYIKGKQTRATFKESGHRAEGLLQIVYSDVMGPFRTTLIFGKSLSFVNETHN